MKKYKVLLFFGNSIIFKIEFILKLMGLCEQTLNKIELSKTNTRDLPIHGIVLILKQNPDIRQR